MNPTPPSWKNIPPTIRRLPRWVVWKNEERSTKSGEVKKTKVPVDCWGKNASTVASHTWAHLDQVKKALEAGVGNGPGFVFVRADGFSGVDLDHCRNPETGAIDAWAEIIMDQLKSYAEVSPSGTGVHILVKGVMPVGHDGHSKSLIGPGYKPGAKLEVFSSGRYFTVTGRVVDGYPTEIADRQDELTKLFLDHFGDKVIPSTRTPPSPLTVERPPAQDDESLIQIIRRSMNGTKFGQLFDKGDTTQYGSDDSAADMALCNLLAFYTAKNQTQMDRIFRRSRLCRDKWDEMRGSSTYGERTIREAISSTTETYHPADPLSHQPVVEISIPTSVRKWDDSLPPGVPGVDKDGVTYVREKRFNKKGELTYTKSRAADGYAFISQETRNPDTGEASFTVQGRGARDPYEFQFDISGRDFADPRKLRAALVAHFGARNRVKDLTGDVIQSLTQSVEKLRLVSVPGWMDTQLAIPGLDGSGLKFRLNKRVPADLSTGEDETGLLALKLVLETWKRAPIPVATALAAPLTARWFPGDRFGLALVGTTGRSHKTETLKHLLATYGAGYLDESFLLRWGDGATSNAMLSIAAACGCLPVGIDNYKATHKDGPAKLVAITHAILEGRERERLNRNAELRETREYSSTVLMTGEDYPQEASTIARILPWAWSDPTDTAQLTQLQKIAHHLPAVGRMWCQHLTSVEEINLDTWRESRARLVEVAHEAGAVNPGRIGTTAAILQMVWKTALDSPLSSVLGEYTPAFEDGLRELITSTALATSEATEGAQFMETLRELVSSGRYKVLDSAYTGQELSLPNVIGWRLKSGEVAILPKLAIDAVRRVSPLQGQEVTPKTLYRQLHEAGLLAQGSGLGQNLAIKRIGSRTVRVLVFRQGALMDGDSLLDEVDLSQATAMAEEDIERRRVAEDLQIRIMQAVRVG